MVGVSTKGCLLTLIIVVDCKFNSLYPYMVGVIAFNCEFLFAIFTMGFFHPYPYMVGVILHNIYMHIIRK